MDLKEPLIKANRVYKYSISYQEITEESREYGEISDDGFIIENETDEIGNLLKLAVETYGIYYPVAFGWWESTNPVENKDYFEKGIETYYILHITNEDGTNITEKEYDFITFLLSDGNYNKDEFTEYAVGGIVAGALALGIGGLIAYYYFNKGKKGYPTGRAWTKEHYNDNDDEDYEVSPNERNIKHKARNRQFDNGGEVKVGDTIYRAWFTDDDGEKSSVIIITNSLEEAEKKADLIDNGDGYFSYISNPIKIKNKEQLFEEIRENEPIYKFNEGGGVEKVLANGGSLDGELFKVHYLKVFEDGEQGDTVYVKEIYGKNENEAISKFKKIHGNYKIEFVSKFANGGMVGTEIEFNKYGETRTGTIYEDFQDNTYAVQSGTGKMLVDKSDITRTLEPKKETSFSFFDNGGGVNTIGFIPMDIEEKLALLSKWGGTNIKGVIGYLNAMIDSGVTDNDLVINPTKNTSFQRERAIEKKIKEIWEKIEPQYKGGQKGNMYYGTLKELIERNYIYENLLQKFKPFRKNQKFDNGGGVSDKNYEERLQYLKMMKNNVRDDLQALRIDKEIQEINTILEHRKNLNNSLNTKFDNGGGVEEVKYPIIINSHQTSLKLSLKDVEEFALNNDLILVDFNDFPSGRRFFEITFEKLKNKIDNKKWFKQEIYLNKYTKNGDFDNSAVKLKFDNGGGVGNSEIKIATLYGKMLNELAKEKQFNKKIEKKSLLDKFSKSNGITIDNNNIIYVNGVKVAFIDKINQKTGQEKSNWEIKKYADGGGVGNDFNYYDGAGARTLNELSLKDLEFQLKHTTKPNETERIEFIKKLIEEKSNKFDNGGGVDTDFEIVVVAKGLEKDGGQIIKDRYYINSVSENEAKNIAEEMWKEDMDNSDFHIIDILTDIEYRNKYLSKKFDNGGEIKSLEKSLENAEKNYRKAILSEQVGIISPTELNRAKNKVNSIY